jgi:competence protein ComGC
MNEPVFRKTKEKFQQQQIKTRQLMVDLAARAYELDKGKSPASLADLVPEYLKAIPQDPFTGTNMIYSPR